MRSQNHVNALGHAFVSLVECNFTSRCAPLTNKRMNTPNTLYAWALHKNKKKKKHRHQHQEKYYVWRICVYNVCLCIVFACLQTLHIGIVIHMKTLHGKLYTGKYIIINTIIIITITTNTTTATTTTNTTTIAINYSSHTHYSTLHSLQVNHY